MLRKILTYGTCAGLFVGVCQSFAVLLFSERMSTVYAMALGYTIMLIALSAVFVGVKRYRDAGRGGVITFWPAFGMGLAISALAGVLYALCWELALAVTHTDFGEVYGNAVIAKQKAAGVSGAELARITADMTRFKLQYANPLFRIPMTFVEIFPVGILVSLVSAAVLRNPRALPARG